jgi:glycosyltransferase involved in cell wall biosynthesis
MTQAIELTVLMPCLNEEKTIAICINKAKAYMSRLGIVGEVVVADNGSTDGSVAIAESLGARIIHVSDKGYGAALIAGIYAAHGKYIVMGDSDDSYDFSALDGFIVQLRDGVDLVMGNRFSGAIHKGAMPMLHQYLGNPVLSYLGRLFCNIKIGDFHCGLRGFKKEKILSLGLTCVGMEFASEMIVKAANRGLTITEIPVNLYKDGRDRAPHLRSFRDGWRHLRFLLLASPKWLFFYPGITVFIAALLLFLPLVSGPLMIGSVGLDIHSLVYLSAGIVIGIQMIIFSSLLDRISENYGFQIASTMTIRLRQLLTFERSLILGGIFIAFGLFMAGEAFSLWGKSSFGVMEPQQLMRKVVPSSLVIIVGLQFILGGALMAGLELIQSTARAARR